MEVKEPELLESQGASACHPEGSVVSEEKRPVPAASETPCFFTKHDPFQVHACVQRNPSKMVGGANSHLESNPIPARDAQMAQTNLVYTRILGPHRDWDRTVFEHLLQRYGLAVVCHRGRAPG